MEELQKKAKLGGAKFYSKYGTAIILLVIFLVSFMTIKNFRTTNNIMNVLMQVNVVTILALGATFVIILGHINVAYGSLLAFVGCAACIVMERTNNMVLAILTALVLGLVIGFINGFIITKFGIPAFIMTLAVTTMARGGALLITGGKNIRNLGNLKVLGQGFFLYIPVMVWILAVLFVFCWILLNKTPFGRRLYAVGGNEKAAIASGIKSKSIVRYAFVLDGLITAIAALVFVARSNTGAPAAGEKYEFDAITAVVVGGTSLSGGSGTLVGTVIGAIIVGIINNIQNLLHVNSQWQKVVKGLIILIAVIADVMTKQMSKNKK